MIMAKKETGMTAQEIVEGVEVEDNIEEIKLEELGIEDRLDRLEVVIAEMRRHLELLANHGHDRNGRVMVPY